MKSFKRSVKALSPVVASIILIAVTVAVSIAVAVWMGALSTGFMQTEQLSITSVIFDNDGGTPPVNDQIVVQVSNTGTTSVKIEQVWVNNIQIDVATAVAYDGTKVQSDGTVAGNAKGGTVTITYAATWTTGDSYQLKLVSAKGTTFLYNAVAA
jgi:flagellin-like protein